MLPDREYFDRKFEEVHSRITSSDKEHAKCAAEIDKRLAAHIAAPCPDVAVHVSDCHKDSAIKNWTLFGTIVAVVTSLWALLISIFRHNGGPKP